MTCVRPAAIAVLLTVALAGCGASADVDPGRVVEIVRRVVRIVGNLVGVYTVRFGAPEAAVLRRASRSGHG